MEFKFNKNDMNFIQFCDYIEVTTIDDNVYIFNVARNKYAGLLLLYEDDYPIKEISLTDSKLTIHYINGEAKIIHEEVKNINIDDYRFRRKYLISIEGTLLKYTEDMAIKYNLDKELSHTSLMQSYVKKRTIK